MNARERLLAVLNFQKPDDHLPMMEWAPWWNETLDRWDGEGLPRDMPDDERQRLFGLDPLYVVMVWPNVPPAPSHGAGVIASEADYDAVRDQIFSDDFIRYACDAARNYKPAHDRGEFSLRIWVDGFFWFPRRCFGIEPHLYAFYDHPDLMKRMNADLLAYNKKAIDAVLEILQPEFIGFAEDMSYNHGPMLSEETFREFLLPNYVALTKHCHDRGLKVLIDSDGDVTTMVPWLIEGGADGIYPLERQAGVDIAEIRRRHPNFIMLGGYDKMVMKRGEAAMRAEFERILPVMRSGGYIPGVDHQTPPEVSLENYKIFIRLFKEYCERGIESGA